MLEKKQTRSWATAESSHLLELSSSRDPCSLWDKSPVSPSEPWGKSPLTDSIMFSPWAIYTPPIKRGGPSAPIFLFSTYSGKALLAQRATSSIKQLEQLFLSIATTPLCCQHWGRPVQTTFQRDSAVLNLKSGCGHRRSIKKWPWPSEDVLILQFPSPTATCCNSREIPAQKHPKKDTPQWFFFPSADYRDGPSSHWCQFMSL